MVREIASHTVSVRLLIKSWENLKWQTQSMASLHQTSERLNCTRLMLFFLWLFGQLFRQFRSFQIGEKWICDDSKLNLCSHEHTPENCRCIFIPGRFASGKNCCKLFFVWSALLFVVGSNKTIDRAPPLWSAVMISQNLVGSPIPSNISDRFWHLARIVLVILHMSHSESLGKGVNLCCSLIGLTLGLGTKRGTSGSLSCVESCLLIQSQVVLQLSLLWAGVTNLAESLLRHSPQLTDVWSLRPLGLSFLIYIHMCFRLWFGLAALLSSKSTNSPSFRTPFPMTVQPDAQEHVRVFDVDCRLLVCLDCSVRGHNHARSVRFRDFLQFFGCHRRFPQRVWRSSTVDDVLSLYNWSGWSRDVLRVTMSSKKKELQLRVLVFPARCVNFFVKFPGIHSSFFWKILDPVFTIFPVGEQKSVRTPLVLQWRTYDSSGRFFNRPELWLHFFDVQNFLAIIFFGLSQKNWFSGVTCRFLRWDSSPHGEV